MTNTEYITINDESREREIPLKIYVPQSPNGAAIIFSHGLGGSMESYKYLGEAWADSGFLSIHPSHDGIDDKLLKLERPFKALKEATNIEDNIYNPPLDIKFVLDWLETQKEFEVDLEKIGIGGHSWGGFTTFTILGQKHSSKGHKLNFKDERIKAAISLSPQAPKLNPEEAFSAIDVPVLHITGKFDDSPVGLTTPEDRQLPFKYMNNSDQYLIVFDKADHMIFAAQRRKDNFTEDDLKIMDSTTKATSEFWKKYLVGGAILLLIMKISLLS